MKSAPELIDEVAKVSLKPCLKLHGFRSKGLNFFREHQDLVDVANIQKGKWNSSSEAIFTINLGVYWRKVQEMIGRTAISFPPKEYECTVRTRLGPLFSEGRDYWWPIKTCSEVSEVGTAVVQKFEAYGLKWLQQNHSLEFAIGTARQIHRYPQAAVLSLLHGDKAGAIALLKCGVNWQPAAQQGYKDLAEKLKLSVPGVTG